MGAELESQQSTVLADFLGANWKAFVAHASDYCLDEDECNEILRELEGQ